MHRLRVLQPVTQSASGTSLTFPCWQPWGCFGWCDCCCCLAIASACMAFFLSLQRLFWNHTRMTRGLSPVSSTRCSFNSASGRGLLAYTVRNVCNCCSESTVRTLGPFSATPVLFRGLEEAGSELRVRLALGLLLALLLDSGGGVGGEGEGEERGRKFSY